MVCVQNMYVMVASVCLCFYVYLSPLSSLWCEVCGRFFFFLSVCSDCVCSFLTLGEDILKSFAEVKLSA